MIAEEIVDRHNTIRHQIFDSYSSCNLQREAGEARRVFRKEERDMEHYSRDLVRVGREL